MFESRRDDRDSRPGITVAPAGAALFPSLHFQGLSPLATNERHSVANDKQTPWRTPYATPWHQSRDILLGIARLTSRSSNHGTSQP